MHSAESPQMCFMFVLEPGASSSSSCACRGWRRASNGRQDPSALLSNSSHVDYFFCLYLTVALTVAIAWRLPLLDGSSAPWLCISKLIACQLLDLPVLDGSSAPWLCISKLIACQLLLLPLLDGSSVPGLCISKLIACQLLCFTFAWR